LLSPVWFLELCQSLRGVAGPRFAPLGKVAIVASAASLILASGAYILSYRCCFTQSAESISNFSTVGGSIRRREPSGMTGLFLRRPFERACFPFTLKTLFRSENHTLIVGAFTGIGIVLASQALFEAARSAGTGAIPPPALLSIPLIVSFFLLTGLRFSFDIPVVLRANWIFRLRTNPDASECVRLARKIMLTFLVPPLLMICLPAYGLLCGGRVGITHTVVVAVMSVLLIEVLLVRFRKIPFTCTAPQFKSNALVSVLFYFVGFLAFTSWTSTAEEWAFADPLWYLAFLPALAGIWLFLERYRGELTYLDKRLIFEERPDPVVETLNLTAGR
jgi:hypothetical protein